MLAAKPPSTGIVFEIVSDDGDRPRRADRRSHGLGAAGVEHIDVASDEVRREARQRLDLPFGPSNLQPDILPLDIAERAQPLSKRDKTRTGTVRARAEKADHRDFLRRLRPRLLRADAEDDDREKQDETEPSDPHAVVLCHVGETRSTRRGPRRTSRRPEL